MKFASLKDKDRYAAFAGVIENHYRYYQYYANTLVAVICSAVAYAFSGAGRLSAGLVLLGSLGLAIPLFFGSRDALKKYYDRANAILS